MTKTDSGFGASVLAACALLAALAGCASKYQPPDPAEGPTTRVRLVAGPEVHESGAALSQRACFDKGEKMRDQIAYFSLQALAWPKVLAGRAPGRRHLEGVRDRYDIQARGGRGQPA